MGPFSILAIYFIAWWIGFLMVLPFGIRSVHEDGPVTPGHDPGAPVKGNFGAKAIAASVIAAVVTFAIWGGHALGWFTPPPPVWAS